MLHDPVPTADSSLALTIARQIPGGLSLLVGLTLIGWEVWFLPRYSALDAQSRLNEGDSEGCLIGLLAIPTFLIGPIVAFVCGLLGIGGLFIGNRITSALGVLLNLIAGLWIVWMFIRVMG